MLARLASYPLFRLTMALATGILASDCLFSDATSLLWLAGTWGITFLLAIILYFSSRYERRMLFGAVIFFNVALLGGILYLVERETVRFDWAEGEAVYIGTIMDVPHRKPKTMQAVVEVEQMRAVTDTVWRKVGRQIMLYWMPDSIQGELKCGNRICFRANVSRPVSEADFSGFDYGLYLERQGIGGTAVAYVGQWQRLETERPLPLRLCALLWREEIVDTFRSWGLEGEVLAVVSALTVGDKSELTRELKESYTAAGTSHILALSGTHIVLLAMIVSWLLFPLRYLRGGKQITGLLVVLFLWLFTFLSGLSPSVIRAVVMYSLCVVAAVVSEGRFAAVSSVSLAAFLMLVYRPMYLFDVSFQLSYVAVLSLLVIYPLVEKLFHCRWKLVNYVWQTMALSFAAQLGTLPFVLCYFGTFPTYFLLANLVVTPLSVVILGLSLVCLACGAFPWLVKGLEWSVRLLNGTMEWVQGLSGSQITSVYFSPFQAWLFALVLVFILLYAAHRSAKRLIGALCCLNLLIATFIVERFTPAKDYLYFIRAGIYTKRERNVSQLLSEERIYQIKELRIALADDSRWRNKQTKERLPLDYVYICRGFHGSVGDLNGLFQIKCVVLDGSLGESFKEQLKRECEMTGLAYVDIGETGSYAVVIK